MCDDLSRQSCREYAMLSRRRFLGLAGGTLAAVGLPAWLPQVAWADSENSARDVLVSIFLRGGCDGLSLCVPHGDPGYYALRPTLAWPRPGSGQPGAVSDLDGFFGLAPAMAPLAEAFRTGDLLFVHACGSPDPTRSHFEAMRFMEVGVPGAAPTLQSGWLGRHLAATSPRIAGASMRAVALEVGLPRTLVGAPKALPIPDLASYDLVGDPITLGPRRRALDRMYRATTEPLKTSVRDALRTIDLLHGLGVDTYQPAGGASYQDNDLGRGFRSAAALIKAEVGVEAIAIDTAGWDTHSNQGQTGGSLERLMGRLATNLAAFHRDLASDGVGSVTTVVMSEFGRNAIENASQGTDHGHGNVMLVLGSHVAGGRVLADWPGLAREQLYEGQDLAITIDYRDVLAEILRRRLDTADLSAVFPDPGYTPVEHGVTR